MRKTVLTLWAACFFVPLTAYAEESVSCESDLGSCTFTKTTITCECSDDSFGGGIASISPDGDEMPLPSQEECKAEIQKQCGLPEGAEQCSNDAGRCVVFADGSYSCQCLDGHGAGSGGSSGGSVGEPDSGSDDGADGSPDGDDRTEPAPMPAETCSSDADCSEPQVCVNGVCESQESEPDESEPVEQCSSNNDCAQGGICVNGECVFEGDKPVCNDVLVETCGTEVPKLSDYCSDTMLTYCVDMFDLYMDKCGRGLDDADKSALINGTWNQYGADIAHCCTAAEDSAQKKEMDAMTACLSKKSCADCTEDVDPVYGSDGADSAPAGEGDNHQDIGSSDGTAEKTTDSASSSGCALVIMQ